MIFSLIFLAELVSLFFLSRILIRYLAQLLFRFTKNHHLVINLLAILFLPGTIIHELSHMLVAGVMLVPVGEIEVWPKVEGNDVKLGTAQIGHTDPFRRMLIGVAPVLIGLSLMLGILYFFKDSLLTFSSLWLSLGVIYLLFEITNTMFSSKKDMEGVVSFFLTILIVVSLIAGAFYLTGFNAPFSFLSSLDLSGLTSFFKLAATLLWVPLMIDLILIFFGWILVRRS